MLGQHRRRPSELEMVESLRHQSLKLDDLAERVSALPRNAAMGAATNQALDIDGLIARLHAMRCNGLAGQSEPGPSQPPNPQEVEEQTHAYDKARTLVVTLPSPARSGRTREYCRVSWRYGSHVHTAVRGDHEPHRSSHE